MRNIELNNVDPLFFKKPIEPLITKDFGSVVVEQIRTVGDRDVRESMDLLENCNLNR